MAVIGGGTFIPFRAGTQKLYGTIGEEGAPVVPRADAPVLLYAAGSRIRSTVSDAGGDFTFHGVGSDRAGLPYMAFAVDPTGQYDPVCKTNLIPSPMPPDPSEHP